MAQGMFLNNMVSVFFTICLFPFPAFLVQNGLCLDLSPTQHLSSDAAISCVCVLIVHFSNLKRLVHMLLVHQRPLWLEERIRFHYSCFPIVLSCYICGFSVMAPSSQLYHFCLLLCDSTLKKTETDHVN